MTRASAGGPAAIAWREIAFTSRKHSRMSGGPAFADRVAEWLLELPRSDDRRRAVFKAGTSGAYDSPPGR